MLFFALTSLLLAVEAVSASPVSIPSRSPARKGKNGIPLQSRADSDCPPSQGIDLDLGAYGVSCRVSCWGREKEEPTLVLLGEPVKEGELCVYRIFKDELVMPLVALTPVVHGDGFGDYIDDLENAGHLISKGNNQYERQWVVEYRQLNTIKNTGTWKRFFGPRDPKLMDDPITAWYYDPTVARDDSNDAYQVCRALINNVYRKVLARAVRYAEERGMIHGGLDFDKIYFSDDLEGVTFAGWTPGPVEPWVMHHMVPEGMQVQWMNAIHHMSLRIEDDTELNLAGSCRTRLGMGTMAVAAKGGEEAQAI